MLVICNGMERSGSTLQYNIARLIVETKGLGRSEGYPFKQGEWEKGAAILQQWQLCSDWVVIKAHSIHPKLESLARDKNTRVLYIFRDPRDVAASCKEFLDIEGPELLAKMDEFLTGSNVSSDLSH
jgi:hypothetical protein